MPVSLCLSVPQAFAERRVWCLLCFILCCLCERVWCCLAALVLSIVCRCSAVSPDDRPLCWGVYAAQNKESLLHPRGVRRWGPAASYRMDRCRSKRCLLLSFSVSYCLYVSPAFSLCLSLTLAVSACLCPSLSVSLRLLGSLSVSSLLNLCTSVPSCLWASPSVSLSPYVSLSRPISNVSLHNNCICCLLSLSVFLVVSPSIMRVSVSARTCLSTEMSPPSVSLLRGPCYHGVLHWSLASNTSGSFRISTVSVSSFAGTTSEAAIECLASLDWGGHRRFCLFVIDISLLWPSPRW